MLLDAQNLFSDAQAITATAVSTNFINLGATSTVPGAPAAIARDLGASDIEILVQVVETFQGLTSLTVSLEMDTVNTFASAQAVASTGAVVQPTLVKGYRFSLSKILFGTTKQYIRLKYTVIGTATAGKITAGIVAGLPSIGR